jgi:cytoskeletal protein CcmA (bactofilin family)
MFNNKKEEVRVQENISNIANIIGKGTSIVGDIETSGNIRIDGKLQGNIKVKAKIALGNGSVVDGNIQAQNAEIEGEIKGTIEVGEVLVLKATAMVHGEISAGKLVVESGARFNGTCRMGDQVSLKENKVQADASKQQVKTAS